MSSYPLTTIKSLYHSWVSIKSLVLSAIIPVSKMSGKFGNLSTWLKDANNFPLKIIFVHDIQDENTGNDLRKLVSDLALTNFILLEGKFGNPGGARNFGMQYIEGKWFTFWDSDDLPNLDNIFKCLERFSTAKIILGSFETVDESGEVQKFIIANNLADSLLKNPGIWRIVFNSELRDKVEFPNLRMAEDQIAISNIGIFEYEVKSCEVIFYRYFINFPGQLTSNNEALDDLIYAVNISRLNLNNTSTENRSFAYGLYVKQLLTGIKMGSPQLKYKLLMHIARSMVPFKMSFFLKVSRAYLWNLKVWLRHD